MKLPDLVATLPAFVAATIAVVGWFAGNWLISRRERANKRRDIRTQCLIDAFRRIARSINRLPSREQFSEAELALAELQLFGTAHQIELTRELMRKLVEGKEAQVDALLGAIRDDLRDELRLEPVKHKFMWIVWPGGGPHTSPE
jgi:hypothetical protein